MPASFAATPVHAATRRELLLGSGALFAWAFVPKIARARRPRSALPHHRAARRPGRTGGGGAGRRPGLGQACAATTPSSSVGKTRRCRLTASLPSIPPCRTCTGSTRAGQAIVVHAAATPYRERSHFDGQDVLESGLARPGHADTGWLNRALAKLGTGGSCATSANGHRFAVGPVTPLVVRGPAPVLSWVPPRLPPVGDDTTMRLFNIYRHTDPTLARVLEERLEPRQAIGPDSAGTEPGGVGPADAGRQNQSGADLFRRSRRRSGPSSWQIPRGRGSGRWRSTAGIRMSMKAWSTAGCRMLGALDGALAAVESVWGRLGETVGRGHHRVRPHCPHQRHRRYRSRHRRPSRCSWAALSRAVGSCRLAGSQGSRPLREPRPQADDDLRAVLKGLLRDHLRVGERALATDIFPGSEGVAPIGGLVA